MFVQELGKLKFLQNLQGCTVSSCTPGFNVSSSRGITGAIHPHPTPNSCYLAIYVNHLLTALLFFHRVQLHTKRASFSRWAWPRRKIYNIIDPHIRLQAVRNGKILDKTPRLNALSCYRLTVFSPLSASAPRAQAFFLKTGQNSQKTWWLLWKQNLGHFTSTPVSFTHRWQCVHELPAWRGWYLTGHHNVDLP